MKLQEVSLFLRIMVSVAQICCDLRFPADFCVTPFIQSFNYFEY